MNFYRSLFPLAALTVLTTSFWVGNAITQEVKPTTEAKEEKENPEKTNAPNLATDEEEKAQEGTPKPAKEKADKTQMAQPVPKAQDESQMKDESTVSDSMPSEGDALVEHDDCGVDFAIMKQDPDKEASRGDRAVYSGFSIKFQDVVSPFSLMTVMVLPEAEIGVEVTDAKSEEKFTAAADDGVVTRVNDHSWKWKAPAKTGHYCIKISRENSADTACLQAFVTVPYNGEDTLNGYLIGKYPESKTAKNPINREPDGFIEVTEENLETWISPHFQLKQFLCKGHTGYPQYVLVRTPLLLKLEALLEEFQKAGYPAETLYVMSGYRTPEYNARIGNKTRLSRHTFGDAADVFIDIDRDGNIDDLNKDGKSDTEDAKVLFELVKNASTEAWRKPLGGGLSIYKKNASRTAFIHVDARGTNVTW